jgi:anaphase-promoting complex subunit 2
MFRGCEGGEGARRMTKADCVVQSSQPFAAKTTAVMLPSESWLVATSCGRVGAEPDDASLLYHIRVLRDAGHALPQALRARVIRDVEARYIRPAAAALAELCARKTGNFVSVADAVQRAHTLIADGLRHVRLVDVGLAKDGSVGPDCGPDAVEPRYVLHCRALFETLVPRSLSAEFYGVFVASFREFGCAPATQQAQFRALCSQIAALGFTPAMQESVSWTIFEEIDDAVASRASGRLVDRALPALREWVEDAVIPWIGTVLSATECKKGDHPSLLDTSPHHGSQSIVSLDQWRKRLAFHLHETLATVRIDQMIQIVAEYPGSMGALMDLKESLLCTDKKSAMVRSLREQFATKILHPGTMTSDILQQYINMIKTLRFLDPSGVVLEIVSDPVRDCLRRRPDTVRCIVSGMTGDGDLYAELERGRSKEALSSRHDDSSTSVSARGHIVTSGNRSAVAGYPFSQIVCFSEEEGDSDAGDDSEAETIDEDEYNAWEPEPLDAPPRQGRWRPGGDAIETLVAIYGSSEQIVKEYRALLADKLMSSFELDVDREGRILELLLQRFGSEAMHDCVIMLKDMRDSHTALTTARAESPAVARDLEGFEVTVISKEFWPNLAEEPSFKPPPELASRMQLFESSFERAKNPRRLRWQVGHGMTKVVVTFDDGRRLDLTLPPLQASIVLRFTHQAKWTVKELQRDLEISDEAALRRRLVSLANQDVIRAIDSSASTYEVIERAADVVSSGGVADDEVTHDSNAHVVDGDDDERAKMAVYETYILGMLNTLKALSLSRIHSVLQMVVKTPAYDKTEAQLAAFLTQLVADGKIQLQAGIYKL